MSEKHVELVVPEGPLGEPVAALNKKLNAAAGAIAMADEGAAKVRLWFMVGIAAATVVATIGLIVAIAASGGIATVLTTGAVAVTGLVVGGLMNPLQTVERDIIFRRWSDMITHTYLAQTADPNLRPSDLTAVAEAANARFAALATAYAATANKSLETVQIVAKKD
ncbi:hypothetical protein [Alloactinosynnema sp. L-07]|uniref:hypothetical protein n=1 Tax=Alloactinosynnema sp. L-07 TaxID=1653480 RepID=UPI00065F002B|nr:hypothetical protein [Alloactinosynnema sp. L-07]CRK60869.1 hypothetical protein [Alloactinosynnema sp. L-07]